jgi:hypothetical protein
MSTKAESESELWRPGWWLGFLWGFAEGTLFFIIPDVLLSWAALTGARCGFRIPGAILAGSIVAGLCMYAWSESQLTALGWLCGRWIRNHPRHTTVLFGTVWILIYAFYWTRV